MLTRAKMIPCLRIENPVKQPYPAVHTYMAYIWEYPPPRGGGGVSERATLTSILPPSYAMTRRIWPTDCTHTIIRVTSSSFSISPYCSHSFSCLEDIWACWSTITPEESKSPWLVISYWREPAMVRLLIVGFPGKTNEYKPWLHPCSFPQPCGIRNLC